MTVLRSASVALQLFLGVFKWFSRCASDALVFSSSFFQACLSCQVYAKRDREFEGRPP